MHHVGTYFAESFPIHFDILIDKDLSRKLSVPPFHNPIAYLIQQTSLARARCPQNENSLSGIRMTRDPFEYLPALILLLAGRPLSSLSMLLCLTPPVTPPLLHVHAVHKVLECQPNPIPSLPNFLIFLRIHDFNDLLAIAFKINHPRTLYLLVIFYPYLSRYVLFN